MADGGGSSSSSSRSRICSSISSTCITVGDGYCSARSINSRRSNTRSRSSINFSRNSRSRWWLSK